MGRSSKKGRNQDINVKDMSDYRDIKKQLAEKENVTEKLKDENQMLWVQSMNNIRSTAMEIISND